MRILIVGGGITGACTGYFLRKYVSKNKISRLDLWEAEAEIGGRMRTLKFEPDLIADIGAQYISTNADLNQRSSDFIYHELLQNGLIESLICKIINNKGNMKNYFTAPDGMSSIVEFLINSTKFDEICLSTKVNCIDFENKCLLVKSENSKIYLYDTVILTMPIPNLLNIMGNYKNFLTSVKIEKFSKIEYSSRFALIIFFNVSLNSDWGAQYIKNDPIFRFVCIDNIKRNRSSHKSAVIFHTDIEFGRQNLNTPLDDVKSILKDHAFKIFPELLNQAVIQDVVCHQWKYSQVISEIENDGYYEILKDEPTLLAAGDWFNGSNFDNCVKSSSQTAGFILNKIKIES